MCCDMFIIKPRVLVDKVVLKMEVIKNSHKSGWLCYNNNDI